MPISEVFPDITLNTTGGNVTLTYGSREIDYAFGAPGNEKLDREILTICLLIKIATGGGSGGGPAANVAVTSSALPTGAATEATLGDILDAVLAQAKLSDSQPVTVGNQITGYATQTTLANLLTRMDSQLFVEVTNPVNNVFAQISDGGDVTLGSTTDTPATTDTGTFSLISLVKRLLGKIPALVGGRLPVDGSGVTQPVSGTVTADVSAADLLTNTNFDSRTPQFAGRLATHAYGVIQSYSNGVSIGNNIPTTIEPHADGDVIFYGESPPIANSAITERFWWLDHFRLAVRTNGSYRVIIFTREPTASTFTVGAALNIAYADHNKIAAVLEFGPGLVLDSTTAWSAQTGGDTLPRLIALGQDETTIYYCIQSVGSNQLFGTADISVVATMYQASAF